MTMNIKISTLDLSFQTRFGLSDETVAEYAELEGRHRLSARRRL